MEVFLIRLLQFILAISLLVLLHEGGHFFFSKLFGVRVEKFYMFFDVGIGKWDGSIFKFKPKNSDTQYGAGWLPLGGYCKIAGMIDESFDTEQMSRPPQPWEFRTKPAWQRLLIMIGGVLVNFLLALFIYSMVMFSWGDSYFDTKDMTMGFKFNQDAKALGFQDHDMLISYDGKPFGRFDVDVYRHIADAKTVTVKRGNKNVNIQMPEDMSLLDMLKTEPAFARPFVPADIEPWSDAILVAFGVNNNALLDIISGASEPYGLLPCQLPANMETVEAQYEDVPYDMQCYVDSEGNTYDFAFGLNWKGVIKDKRVKKYAKNYK